MPFGYPLIVYAIVIYEPLLSHQSITSTQVGDKNYGTKTMSTER